MVQHSAGGWTRYERRLPMSRCDARPAADATASHWFSNMRLDPVGEDRTAESVRTQLHPLFECTLLPHARLAQDPVHELP